jgi:hypothetical protein
MLPLKNPRDLIYSAYQVCEVELCKNEATRIYASSESRIVDLCDIHYDHIISERFTS